MDVAILARGPAGPRGTERRCGCAAHAVRPPGAQFKMQKLVPRGEKLMLRTFRESEARFGCCDGPGTLKHAHRAPEPFSARCAPPPRISAPDRLVRHVSVRARTTKHGSEHRILALMRIIGHCRPYHSRGGFPIHHGLTPRCVRHGARGIILVSAAAASPGGMPPSVLLLNDANGTARRCVGWRL